MKKQKLFKLVSIIVVLTVLSACSNYKFKPTTSFEIDDFTHTNHRGEEVTLDDLKGKPWLGMFIFTSCITICPPMTDNMRVIQQQLEKEGIVDYNIVGFSVDPTVDTPEILADYLGRYGVPDESKWHLMTGYDQTYIEQFARNNFKAIVQKVEGNDQVAHNSIFYLVDEQGIAVKNYTGYSTTSNGVPVNTIVEDMRALIEERLQ